MDFSQAVAHADESWCLTDISPSCHTKILPNNKLWTDVQALLKMKVSPDFHNLITVSPKAKIFRPDDSLSSTLIYSHP